VIELNSIKLLFVDDQKENTLNYISFFTKYCHTIEVALDGEEAYAKYKEFNPDVILLDINLAKLDGLQVLEKIREEDTTTKIIMFTAHNEKKFIDKAYQLGVSKYLLKPVTRDELKNALKL